MTHWRAVQSYAAHIPSVHEHFVEHGIEASGVLLLDGKYVNILGHEYCILIAYDTKLGVVSYEIDTSENATAYRDIVQGLLTVGYPLQCIVSDGHTSIEIVCVQLKVPHQRCIFHVLKDLRGMLTENRELTGGNLILFSRLRFMLLAKTVEGLAERHAMFQARTVHAFKTATQRYAIQWFTDVLPNATIHLSFEPDQVPRTSNAIENLIGQIEARLKTFRGVKSAESLHNLLKVLFRFRNYK
jgi:transposase-like protein